MKEGIILKFIQTSVLQNILSRKKGRLSWEKIFAKQIFDNLYLEYTELLWLNSKTTQLFKMS